MPPAPPPRRPGAPARRRSWPWRYRRLLFLVTLLSFTALAGTAYLLVRVPLPPENVQDQTTFLTDANGVRLASLDAGENRVSVSLEKVPKVVVDAVLATEDRAFFDHGGIDPTAIVRATWADVRGKPLQGGSTITQQYVKNVYLRRDRTLWRKIKEAVLAVKMERRHDKEEILERYLNTIYLGRGAYGVQAAARAYFGKDVGQLGLREAAYLAGLIRSPEAADALDAPAAAATRRSRTLAAMERHRLIRPAQRAAVEAQPLATYVVEPGTADPTVVLPEKGTQYFVEYARQELLRVYPPAALYRGGLRIRTTLDLKMQSQAYDAVYGFLSRPEDPAGALVAIDANGHVKAMVGGRSWVEPAPWAKVNLAAGRQGGGTGRQPGSTFKAFVLAAAVREGYTVESAFPGPREVIFPKADQGRDYKVENFESEDFGPSVNLIDATRNSVNTVYAQLISALGPEKVVQLAREAGITSDLVPNISLTFGTSEVSVLELASAFTTFANRGVHVEPSVILDISTADGRVLRPARAPARNRVMETRQADVVNFCLQQVVQRGSGSGALFGKAVAGKTGTTQDFGDAWFVGYTPKLTAAVWMGYPEGNVRKMTNVRGRKVNGGSFPATVFKRFMSAATKGVDAGTFPAVTSFPGKVLKGSSRVVFSTTTSTSAPRAPAPPAGPAPPPSANGGGATSTSAARPAPAPTSSSTTAPARPPPASTTTTTSRPPLLP